MSGETIDLKYQDLLNSIRMSGRHFDGRNGGTQAIINRPITIGWNMHNDAFPIISIRKQNFLHYLNEFLWEINGGDNINDLNGKYVPDLDSRFLWKPWASKHSDYEGHIFYSYGASWRKNGEVTSKFSVDQLKMIEYMLKDNPTTRRLTLITQDVTKNALINDEKAKFNENLGKIYPPQVPPCHPAIYFTSDGTFLNLHVTSRSQDVICGLPGDMIRYHLMAVCLAKISNLIPGEIWFSFTNVHYYKEHEEKIFNVLERWQNQGGSQGNYPKLTLEPLCDIYTTLDDFVYTDFFLDGYVPSKFESFPLIV